MATPKEMALEVLEKRREANKDRPRLDNSSLPAGSPMYFYCIVCGGLIIVPETYMIRPKLCNPCSDMKTMGWLD
jgi:hypothetical protein